MANHSQTKKPTNVPSAAFDPWLLWVAFRRHWAWVISAGMVLATIGAVIVLYTFVPEYEATHILQANNDFVLSKDLIDVPKDLAKNERPLIMSPVVMDEVLADPELLRTVPSLSNSDTRETEIRKRVRISNGGAEDLLMITYRDTDKKTVWKVANAIAASYVQERRRYDELRLKNLEQSLVRPIEQSRRNVEEARRAYEALSEKVYGKSPFSNATDAADEGSSLGQARRTLVDLGAKEGTLVATLEGLKSDLNLAPNAVIDEQEIKKYVDDDDKIKDLRSKIAFNEAEIRKIEHKEMQGILAGRYKDLKKELDLFKSGLSKAITETQTKAQGALRERIANTLRQSIRSVEAQLLEVKTRIAAISEELEQEKVRLAKHGIETADLVFANKKLNYETAYFDKLNDRFFALRAEQGRGASIASRSDAKEPKLALEETPIKKMVLIGALAFVLPFFLAVLIEFRAKRITSAESIDTNQLIPILGEIARIPSARSRSSQRIFEESVDAMRANLLFKMEHVRSIAVTSAMSGEGKSSIAFELAHSIARCTGENVLVIDADLRNPDQHDLFGLEVGSGLCKLLSGESMLDKCIDSNDGELVHLLSAGKLDSNPHNLLTKNNVNQVLSQVSARYRYIVVDTAPVLPAAETLTVTAACDATLLCAMRDVSQSEHVKRTFRRLEESGSNVIGTVFSGVPARLYASRYGDYRYAKDA